MNNFLEKQSSAVLETPLEIQKQESKIRYIKYQQPKITKQNKN